jgi:hypothetical protein
VIHRGLAHDVFRRHFDCFRIACFYPGDFRIRCNDLPDKRCAIAQSDDLFRLRGRRSSRTRLLQGGLDLRRCSGNRPRSDDLAPTTRRAHHCACAFADFTRDRGLTSTRRTLANIRGRSIPYLDDLPHVGARPSVPSFGSRMLLPEFLRIMAGNGHVFPNPHGKLHTFPRTIDLSVFAPRSFAYDCACSLTL